LSYCNNEINIGTSKKNTIMQVIHVTGYCLCVNVKYRQAPPPKFESIDLSKKEKAVKA
jgi:hypothetical protein